jgi:hypothetical protein
VGRQGKDGSALVGPLYGIRTVQKFSKALGADKKSDMPASEDATIAEDSDAGKLQLKAKNRNANAVTQFTVAFITETAMAFIYEGMVDADWPGGLANICLMARSQRSSSVGS